MRDIRKREYTVSRLHVRKEEVYSIRNMHRLAVEASTLNVFIVIGYHEASVHNTFEKSGFVLYPQVNISNQQSIN